MKKLIFVLTFLIHATSPVSNQGDSRWTVFTALSLLREGNTDLNEFAPRIVASDFYAIECILPDGSRRYPIKSLDACPGGRFYNFYPISIAFAALPSIALQLGAVRLLQPVLAPIAARIPLEIPRSYLQGDFSTGSPVVEIVSASLIAAAAAMLFFVLARRFLDQRQALALTALFAVCSPLWSTASRALWQHGPYMLLLIVVLWLLDTDRLAKAGLPMAFAFFVRPTAAVPILVFGLYILWRSRAAAWKTALWAMPVVAVFGVYYWHIYGTPIAPYFLPVRAGSTSLAFHSAYAEALLGNLISPARGLLVYMPFAALGAVAWFWNADPRWRRLAPWVGSVIIGHWLLISFHTDWWGGHCYGPRYFSDVTPLLLFLLIPLVRSGPSPVRGLVAVLALWALFAHYKGAHTVAGQWNLTPVNVNDQTSRLWDWHDPPFFR